METTNLAGRAGRWSAAHWKRAAFGWILFAVVAVVVGGAVGTKQLKSWAYTNGDKMAADLEYVMLPDSLTALIHKQWADDIMDAASKAIAMSAK